MKEKILIVLVVFLVVSLFMGCQGASTEQKLSPGEKEPYPSKEETKEIKAKETPEETLPQKEVSEKMKVLMIIATNNFRDEEYERPREIFEANGMEVVVASSSLDIARGMLGMTVKPDILVDEVRVEDYAAIVFVGGSGADEYYTNSSALSIAKEAANSNKILAAICIAPVTLANAGVLAGKRATVFSSKINEIKNKGAIYVAEDVVKDGNIITASGSQAAYRFGQTIVEALKP